MTLSRIISFEKGLTIFKLPFYLLIYDSGETAFKSHSSHLNSASKE
jgi:hypothetical protein